MSMKITLPDFPDKHDVPNAAVADQVTCPASHCYFETSIHIVDDKQVTYEIEVRLHLGPATMRVQSLCKVVDRLEMLAICMEAAPGEADAWIKDLMCDEDYEHVKRHYYGSKTYLSRDVLRA